MKLRLATRNKRKQKEMEQRFAHLPIMCIAMGDNIADIEETGSTFLENASLKAKTAQCYYPNDIIVGEDSGLMVSSLDGFPGVKTARFLPGHDRDRAKALVEKLSNYSIDQRQAYFHSVISILFPDGQEKITKGSMVGWIGEAADQPINGYEDIFQLANGSYLHTLSEQGFRAFSPRQISLRQASLIINHWLREKGENHESNK